MYKQVKEDVLKQYESFLELVKAIYESGGSVKASSLIALQNQAANIRRDKFCLLVAGETSSGKSTFINAYLGKEILPVDVLSCTSAIVEIRYGEKILLKATYADDREILLDEEDEIRKFLDDNAVIDSKNKKYSGIPVQKIDMGLLVKKQGKAPVKYEIEDLMKEIAPKDGNMSEEKYADYERRVKEYISERTPHWMDIVKKIEIEYPFEDEDLKGIEIFDTPGVNTLDRAGDITHSYIKKANAIMFLKPLVGGVIDATSFIEFVKENSTDRNKNALFLILTMAANNTKDNNERMLQSALEKFPEISREQIIMLDSKVEVFLNHIKDMSAEELCEYMTPLIEEGKLDSFLESPWYKAKFQREDYLRRLKEISNFDVIDESLNKFAHMAHYIALGEFLERMIKVLDAIEGQMGENLSNYRKKAVDPLKLEAELANKKDELEAIKLKINTIASRIGSQYTDSGGVIEKKAEEVSRGYERAISAIDESSVDSMERLEKITFRHIDKFVDYQKQLEKDIVKQCDDELVSISKKSDIPFTILQPNLTPEIIEEIKNEQKNNAFVMKFTKGGCFKKASSYSEFSQSRFFHLVRDDIKVRLQEIKTDFIVLLSDFVTDVLKAYRDELVANADTVQKEYDKVLNDKAEAEELQEKIRDLESTIAKIAPLREETELIKRGVDKHV